MKGTINENFGLRDQLLQVMIDNEGSDMYITVGSYPAIKINSEIVFIDEGIEKLEQGDTIKFSQALITEKQHDFLIKNKNLDFAFTYSNRRFRTNISFQMGIYMIVIRLLGNKVPEIDDLGLPDIYKNITKFGQGLVLVTGPTGSGKTTTLASMINYINTNYSKHIITIEDPVEYIHEHKKSIVEQKEIGKDVDDYETALAGAMRQNPQVILFGEMRTTQEMEMALTLAETGHLVFSTLHTRGAYQTISRIIDSFESGQQNQIRLQLADSLIGIFSQRLLRLSNGSGVKMVKEILIRNTAIINLIRENDIHQIPSIIQMSSRDGMQILEKDIIDLINGDLITLEEGLKYANNPKIIQEGLK
ncbi:MAG: PilT/PilU family type 4a pilus ATPase [Candidatus Gracilibacteria bacterium]|nr:PilT/PilU family type 4a pilus ATPase [Candidatus Gracilibacteria bacterium]